MGRIQVAEEGIIHHLSHEHPLQLTSFTQSDLPNLHTHCCGPPPPSSSFAAAATTITEPIYTCTPCNFFIHKSCSKLPQLITHPSHPSHTLTLLPLPVYLNGSFSCDACSKCSASVFSYHCNYCSYDLHTHCATLPLTVSHGFHPHPLSLSFFCPHPEQAFTCDICFARGGHAWLYRCSPCGFDAHLDCARAVQPTQSAVIPVPATGVPVRPPTSPVAIRSLSQPFWDAGQAMPNAPVGPPVRRRSQLFGGSAQSQRVLTGLMCSLVGIPPGLVTGLSGRATRAGVFRGPSLVSGVHTQGGGGGGEGWQNGDIGDKQLGQDGNYGEEGGYDCNYDWQSQSDGVDAQQTGCLDSGDVDFGGFDCGAVDFGGFYG